MEHDVTNSSFHISMIEIVMIVGIFTVVGVLILQLFFTANSFSKAAENTSKALIQSETVAEILKSSDSFERALLELGASEEGQDTDRKERIFFIHYNRDWKHVQEPGIYTIKVLITEKESQSGKMELADITAFTMADAVAGVSATKEWCQLTIKKFQNN